MDKTLVEQQVKLMRAVAEGDRRAFEQLYRLTSPHLFAVALRTVQRRAWAEEILHDAFLTIWNKASGYDPAISAPVTWLTHIVRNRCIDWLRSGQSRAANQEDELSDNAADRQSEEDNGWCDEQQAGRLRGCLDNLTSEQRQSVVLAYYQGMSHGDIADWLQQPLGTVKSWIRRALDHLKDCVGL
ncbi:sigma-70 family RNA polymerase sigma factor [Enterobacter sp. Cy-643]|uniref:RNA polymerase sigma factor n=1 Tax=Enterobacter sp. Cy-643 TaxID=2608346 RepID=UPI00141F689C|nr:sigma-70 family RNA polymerase sigma factor [Enterobacter sp. Cy-643]NIF31705.1 sigma-70 family RNA polymerase sigma factor [Enterobacter sp. Cy-643]